jgi:hypothetical protein
MSCTAIAGEHELDKASPRALIFMIAPPSQVDESRMDQSGPEDF